MRIRQSLQALALAWACLANGGTISAAPGKRDDRSRELRVALTIHHLTQVARERGGISFPVCLAVPDPDADNPNAIRPLPEADLKKILGATDLISFLAIPAEGIRAPRPGEREPGNPKVLRGYEVQKTGARVEVFLFTHIELGEEDTFTATWRWASAPALSGLGGKYEGRFVDGALSIDSQSSWDH